MSSLARRLARPEILGLPAAHVAGDCSGDPEGIVRLHLNENGFPPLAQGEEALGLNRYPDPRPPALRGAMARLYGVADENLLVTRGADDAIDLLLRTFCRSGEDRIAICEPTFAAYALFAKIQGAGVVRSSLGEDFAFDATAYVETVRSDPSVKLAFLCSPNNPTGNRIAPDQVLEVADALGDRIVVLDEAYIEFADIESLAPEAARRDNLVVLRTLSKAYGIAGARIGCAIANDELIGIAGRALPPFPLPRPSIALALSSLSPSRRPVHEDRIERIRAERERIARRLRQSPLVRRVWPSQANFLLLEVNAPKETLSELDKRGIRVRRRPDLGDAFLRLSISSEEENELALAAFGLPGDPQGGRRAVRVRDTKETKIAVAVDLDRPGPRTIRTGIGFFDHMLDQVAAHGGFSLVLACEGDLEVDAHHSIEDCALALGGALSDALSDRRGIGRFGFALPMDEAEAQVLIDLSGRPSCRFEGEFASPSIGSYPTEMTAHVFRSLADSMRASIQVRVSGENDHHKTEACFKAFGRALRQAIAREADRGIPSTKGVLA